MKTDKGFTIIEFMIVICISAIVMAAVFAVFISQKDTYQGQDQVAETQQNLRAVMSLLVSDIRMVGYDPLGTANANTADIAVITATAGRFIYTVDSDSDGVPIFDGLGAFNETVGSRELIEFGFSADGDNDGIPDSGNAAPFMIQTDQSGVYQELAENIEAVEFRYLNNAGVAIPVPVSAANIPNIVAVQVTMLARVGRPDPNFNGRGTFNTPGGQVWAYNDDFYRRMLTTTVRCRNLP